MAISSHQMRAITALAATFFAVLLSLQPYMAVHAANSSTFSSLGASTPSYAFQNPSVTVADVPHPEAIFVTLDYDAITFSSSVSVIDIFISYSGETSFIIATPSPRCEIDGFHTPCTLDTTTHILALPIPVASFSEGAGRVTVLISAAHSRSGELAVDLHDAFGTVLGSQTLASAAFVGTLDFMQDAGWGPVVISPSFVSEALQGAGDVIVALKAWEKRHIPTAMNFNSKLSTNGFQCKIASNNNAYYGAATTPCELMTASSSSTIRFRIAASALSQTSKKLFVDLGRAYLTIHRDMTITAELENFKSFVHSSVTFAGSGDTVVYGLALGIDSFTRTVTITTTDAMSSSGLITYSVMHSVWSQAGVFVNAATCTTSYGSCSVRVMGNEKVGVEVSIDAREVTLTMPDGANLNAYVQIKAEGDVTGNNNVDGYFYAVHQSSSLGAATLSHRSPNSSFDVPMFAVSARFAATANATKGSGRDFAIHLPENTPLVRWTKCHVAMGSSAYQNATEEVPVVMRGGALTGTLPQDLTLSSEPVFVSMTCQAAPTAVSVFPIKGTVSMVIGITWGTAQHDKATIFSQAEVDITTLFDVPSSEYVLALTTDISQDPAFTVASVSSTAYSPTWAGGAEFRAFHVVDLPRNIVRLAAELNHVSAFLGGNNYAHGWGSLGYIGSLTCPAGQICLQCGTEYVVEPSCKNYLGHDAALWTCLFDTPLPSYGGCPLAVTLSSYNAKTIAGETHLMFTIDVVADPKLAPSTSVVAVKLPETLTVDLPTCVTSMSSGWCNAGGNVAKMEVSVPVSGSISIPADISVVVASDHSSSWSLDWSVTLPQFGNRSESGSVAFPAAISVVSANAGAVSVVSSGHEATTVDIRVVFPDPSSGFEINYINVTVPPVEAVWTCKALLSVTAGAAWVLRSGDWIMADATGAFIPLPQGVAVDDIVSGVISCSSVTNASINGNAFAADFGSAVFGPVVAVDASSTPLSNSVIESVVIKEIELGTNTNAEAVMSALMGDISGFKNVSAVVTGSTVTVSVLVNSSDVVLSHVDATLVSVLGAADGVTVTSSTGVYTGAAGHSLTVSCGNVSESVCTTENGTVVPTVACIFAATVQTDAACIPSVADSNMTGTVEWDTLTLNYTGSAANSTWVVQRDYTLAVALPQGLLTGASATDAIVCSLTASGIPVPCATDPAATDSLLVHIPFESFVSDSIAITIKIVTSAEVLAPFTVTYSVVDAESGDVYSEIKSTSIQASLNFVDVSGHVPIVVSRRGPLSFLIDLGASDVPSGLVSKDMAFSLRGSIAGPLDGCSAVLVGANRLVSYLTDFDASSGFSKLSASRGGDHQSSLTSSVLLSCPATTVAEGEEVELLIARAHGRVRVAAITAPGVEAPGVGLCHRAALRLIKSENESSSYSEIVSFTRNLVAGFFDLLVNGDADETFLALSLSASSNGSDELAAILRLCSASADAMQPEWAPAADSMLRMVVSSGVGEKVLSHIFSSVWGSQTIVTIDTNSALVSVPGIEIDFKCAPENIQTAPSRSACALMECSIELVTPMLCYYRSDFTASDDECAMRVRPTLDVHGCHAAIRDVAFAVASNYTSVSVDFLTVPFEDDASSFALMRDITVQFALSNGTVNSTSSVTVYRVLPDLTQEETGLSATLIDGILSVTLDTNVDSRYRIVISDVSDVAAFSDGVYSANRSVLDGEGAVLFNSQAAFSAGVIVSVAESSEGNEVFVKIGSSFFANTSTSSGFVVFGSPLFVGAQCGFAELESEDDITLDGIFPDGFAGIVSITPFGRAELASDLESSYGVGVRCATSGSLSSVQVALRGDDGLLYKSFTTTPRDVPDLAANIYAMAVSSNVTADAVHAALVDALPAWASGSVRIAALSTTGDTQALVFRLSHGIQMYLPSVGAVVTALNNVANVTVIVPEGLSRGSPSFGTIFVSTQAGQWLCASDGQDRWAPCAVSEDCGDEYSGTLACVTESGVVHDSESLDALVTCSFAAPPLSLPVWTGCGSLACLDAEGLVIACNSPAICVDGCAANIPITPELIANERAFKPVCTKNGMIASDSLCPEGGVTAPVYAQTCDAKAACGPVCTDVDGVRHDCDSDEAWDSCSSLCGNGTQAILHYACAHRDSPMSAVVVGAVPESFCGDWSEGPGFPTNRSCVGIECSSYAFYCRPVAGSDDDWLRYDDDRSYGFGVCSNNCGVGERRREIGCGEIDFNGNLVAVAQNEDALHLCANTSESIPATTEDCEDSTCPDAAWMCKNEEGAIVDCADVPFPACPVNLCHDVSNVTRAVICASKSAGIAVDENLCSLAAPSTLTCPKITSGCVAVFADDAECHTTDGDIVTCQDPESPLATRQGSCADESRTPVPNDWCDAAALQGACALPECDCPEGYHGFNCEKGGPEVPEPVIVTVSVSVEPSTINPNEYTVHWTVPEPPIESDASLVLVYEKEDGTEGSIDIGSVPVMDGVAIFDASEIGALPGKYVVKVSVPGRVSGTSEPFHITPVCSREDHTCIEGKCDMVTGMCACEGSWSGSRCDESPCITKGCNPSGSSCVVSAGEASCECLKKDGVPLFTGALCLTPAVGCENEEPCANGGVRNGSLLESGEVDCGQCACEAHWTGPLCESCGLVCLNHGEHDSGCSECQCASARGYYGDQCQCRIFYMRFVVLAKNLPFSLAAAGSTDERSRLLTNFAKSFAADLAETSSMSYAAPDGAVTEHTASDNNLVLTLNLVVGPSCSELSGTVSDDDMRPTYAGVSALKTMMNAKEHTSHPFFGLVDTPSGFAAFDPNCELLTGCPSNYARGAVYVPAGSATDGEGGSTEVPKKKNSGLSTGALAGIIAGAISLLLLLLLLLLAFCCGWCCFKKKDGDEQGGNNV